MKINNYKAKKHTQSSVDKTKKKSRYTRKQAQSWVQIMNGDFLTKDFVLNNLNYIFFIIFLMILMVSKGYYINQLSSDIQKEENAMRDIVTDYVATKAELEERTRRTEMIEKLDPLGLKETVNPTKVIRIKKRRQKIK